MATWDIECRAGLEEVLVCWDVVGLELRLDETWRWLEVRPIRERTLHVGFLADLPTLAADDLNRKVLVDVEVPGGTIRCAHGEHRHVEPRSAEVSRQRGGPRFQ